MNKNNFSQIKQFKVGKSCIKYRTNLRHRWAVLFIALQVAILNAPNILKNIALNRFSTSSEESLKTTENVELLTEVKKWSNPQYARKKLKIYYYDIPERFNWYWVKTSHTNPPKMLDPYCDENFYSAEIRIARFFETSSVRTFDPKEANFFYVPIFATCYLQSNLPKNLTKTGSFFKTAMDFIIETYPFWNRTDGRDHIFTFAQGNAALLSGDWVKYKLSTFLVHNGDYTQAHYNPLKDIVVPPHLSHYIKPVWLETGYRRPKKNYLAMFGGSVLNNSVKDENGKIYSGGIRQKIYKTFSRNKRFRLSGVRSSSYVRDMISSNFCLAPEGWHKWSPRPAYAILLGCIPVVISEKQELFLENILDYSQLSVGVEPKNLSLLYNRLQKMTRAEILEKESAIRAVWKLFWYGDDGLAEEAILFSLYRKLKIMKSYRTYSS